MTLKRSTIIICAILSAAHLAVKVTADSSEEDALPETRYTKLKNIYAMDGCEGNVCRGFQYGNVSEVAFFDLKAEVRIRDKSTYDIAEPLQYDQIVFENSSFAHFPLHLFYAIGGVKELDMRNCSVELVTWENFLMAGDLKILLLSQNRIEHIAQKTFNFASELQYLFLDANRIRSLVSESFAGLNELKYLDLKDNLLRELPDDMFNYLPALQELNLAQNRLHSIGNDMFLNNPNLLTVVLSENRLRELGDYAFKSQSRLVLLDISHNTQLEALITNVQARFLVAANCSLYRVNVYGAVANVDLRDNRIMELYFSQPESLETLNLRNNALQQIASLNRAVNLRFLDLADNPDMSTLPVPWTVDSLERLDLSNTSMTWFPAAALAEHSNLRSLNVSSNKLKEISPRNFKHLEGLTHFYIHANDWNCYNLNMLMDLLIRPLGITHTVDRFDPEFPGEYVNGIACMYRLEDSNENDNELPNGDGEVVDNAALMSAQLNTVAATVEQSSEINNLRNELKAIAQIYEQRMDTAFTMIDDLNMRLQQFERMNETFWQHITIST